MQILRTNIPPRLQRFLRRYIVGKDTVITRPERDWLGALLLTAIGVVTVTTTGVAMFLDAVQSSAPQSPQVGVETINIEQLSNAVEYFDSRAQQYAQFGQSVPARVDPSRPSASLELEPQAE